MLVLRPVPVLGEIIGTASVTDGDAINIHGERIRFHGIDAPESRQLSELDGEPWMCGKDAANALADWIARRPVTGEELYRDRYDRIVARCSVAGEDMGEWMVSHGWAVAYDRYSDDYERAEYRAKSRIVEVYGRASLRSLGTGGLVWLSLEASDDAGAPAVRGALGDAGGHALLVRAPEAVREKACVFHPPDAALAGRTARVKESIDPRRVLNPGRMYNGV